MYSGNGWVAMRIVWTSKPRDSKTVRAYFSIFTASAICSRYCVRSRLTNAVMARIFCFCSAGAFLCCAVPTPHSETERARKAVIPRMNERRATSVNAGMELSPVGARYTVPLQHTRFNDSRVWLAGVGQALARLRLHSHKCGNARDLLPDDQLVDVVCSFVGINTFEVVHVPHDAVIVDDAVRAKNIARLARRLQSDGHVVHLQHGDVGEIHFAVVLQSSDVQRQQLALHNFRDHPRQFFLYELVR